VEVSTIISFHSVHIFFTANGLEDAY